jgi:signal transduction histidine kinase/HD-like signal output (HDOD) protein
MTGNQQKRVELILQQLEELPTLPAVAARLLRVTGEDDSSVREVVELLSADPSLTARILRMVHRADLGTSKEINSVERAVVMLGFEAVRHAVLAVSVFQCFAHDGKRDEKGGQGGHFDREAFWKHSIAVGAAAESLARAATKNGGRQPLDAGEAFVCGLLHDLGKVALDTALPKSFDRVAEAAELLRGDIADIERQVIGLDHMVAGKRLAERWGLSVVVREAIWLHGQRPAALPVTVASPRMINLITLADMVARRQHLGFSGNYTFAIAAEELSEAVGISRQQVEEAASQLVANVERHSQSLGLGDANADRLYQEALASANRQLGRVSMQLAEKNRRLSVRAKFFDALAGFQEELRPDASAQHVMAAIGQTAIGAIQTGSCCVFSMMPGRNWAEAILVNEAGTVFDTTLMDCPAEGAAGGTLTSAASGQGESRPRLHSADGPVLPAGKELEWILEAISPRLEHERRYWIALRCEGECIGGVLWGAPGGESDRLGAQVRELSALASGWSLALRTAQVREESRQLAEQLAEANRRLHGAQSELTRGRAMVGIGEMAAGAAHEMNNPLAIISGRSQLLASQLEDPKLKHAASQIHEQSHRLSQIITELMDFARPQAPQIRAVDPAELIERALHDVKLESDWTERAIELTLGELPMVNVDPHQVMAALREILHNALHATSSDGRIAIHAAHDPTGGRVVIHVSDNGPGMDEATARHAFDPFYSHRPAGRRRGMGLAKALRWVEASGGTIRLETHLGQGTRMLLLLPEAARSEASEAISAKKIAN